MQCLKFFISVLKSLRILKFDSFQLTCNLYGTPYRQESQKLITISGCYRFPVTSAYVYDTFIATDTVAPSCSLWLPNSKLMTDSRDEAFGSTERAAESGEGLSGGMLSAVPAGLPDPIRNICEGNTSF